MVIGFLDGGFMALVFLMAWLRRKSDLRRIFLGLLLSSISVAPVAWAADRSSRIAPPLFTINPVAQGKTSSANLLQNPGFESGVLPWRQSTLGAWDPISADGSAYSGVYMAWMGGYDNAKDIIEQTITLPVNASGINVEFWYAILTSEPLTSGALDTLTLELYSLGGAKLATLATLSNSDSTAGAWVKSPSFNVDVSAFKGQMVNLRFTATTDSTDFTEFFVDDVSLTATVKASAKSMAPILMLLLD